jgi:hypothetical protein
MKPINHYRKYTDREDKYIKDNFLLYPISEIAEHIGRTEISVRQRAYYLKIDMKSNPMNSTKGKNKNKSKRLESFLRMMTAKVCVSLILISLFAAIFIVLAGTLLFFI